MAREAEPSGKKKDGDQPGDTAQGSATQGSTASGNQDQTQGQGSQSQSAQGQSGQGQSAQGQSGQFGQKPAAGTQMRNAVQGQAARSQNDDADDDDDDDGDIANDGFAQLRAHHGTLRALLGEASKVTDGEEAEELLDRLSSAWARHAAAHELLYESATDAGLREFPALNETAIDGDLVSFLLRAGEQLYGPMALAALRVAARLIGEIIEREEKPRSGLLAKAKAAGVDPAALGRDLGSYLTAPSRRGGMRSPRLRHLTAIQEDNMPRNSNMPERDEYGRFVSDDDRGGRGRSSGRDSDDRERDSRGRFMSDDDRGGRGRSSGRDSYDRERDSRGRFMSDDDRGGRSRSSSRYDDDDRRYSSRGRDDDDDDRGYSRDRGQGGWFGDPRGHSEAARLGWEHRRDDDDDDYGRGRSRSSSRYDDDDRRYSSSSRGGRDRDDDRGSSRDRGQGGWFGDPRGHSEAARLGWEHRRDDDDDDYGRGRSRSSSRYDDDDDRRSSSRGRR